MERARAMVSPSGNPPVKYLLIYAVIVVGGLIVGDAVGDSSLVSEMVKQFALIGPVLFLMMQKREEDKKEIEERQSDIKQTIQRGLNGELDARIEAAIERVLERWTKPQ